MIRKLAWKNIWRNKTRSILFICTAIFGIALAIFALNLMKSIANQRLEDAINIQTGHLQIHQSGFTNNKELKLSIKKSEDILKKVNTIQGIQATSSHLVTNGMVASPENSFVTEIKGVYPEKEAKLSELKKYLLQGDWFGDKVKKPVLISKKLADKLHLKLHSKLIITLENTSGDLQGAAFRIAGVFKTTNASFDESNVLVTYQELSQLTGVSQPHEIAIKLSNPKELPLIQQKIQRAIGLSHEVNNWRVLLPELFAFSGFTDMVSMLFTTIILLGLGFGLLNTMNMIVQERTREIGMLRAIGQSQFTVFRVLVQEASIMMFIGTITGIMLGLAIIYISSITGISLGSGLKNLGIAEVIYPTMHWTQLTVIILMTIIFTLIVATIPAYRAFHIDPSLALKE